MSTAPNRATIWIAEIHRLTEAKLYAARLRGYTRSGHYETGRDDAWCPTERTYTRDACIEVMKMALVRRPDLTARDGSWLPAPEVWDNRKRYVRRMVGLVLQGQLVR